MNAIDSLKPQKNQRIMDLVEQAGIDVRGWTKTKGHAASNPAHCYEWAFVNPGEVVVLNVWHGELRGRNGQLWCDLNLRSWFEQGRNATTLKPSERSALSKRAKRMDEAIARAHVEQLPVRLIVGAGEQRDISDPKSKAASRMRLRLLDPLPWAVVAYDEETGQCRLARGEAPIYIDQFTAPKLGPAQQLDVNSKVWKRDRKIRDAALFRAGGKCELCAQAGFQMVGGRIYLETHHVIQLSENGADHERNVVALCANEHREAHHGLNRDAIKTKLLMMLSKIYDN